MKDLFRLLLIVPCILAGHLVVAQPLPELIPYKAATGWGYSDSNKAIRIPCIYSGVSLFYNGRGRVTIARDGETVHCIVNRKGEFIVGPEQHWTGEMNLHSKFGMLNAHDGAGRWGGIDTNGEVVIPFLYDGPRPYEAADGYRSYDGYTSPLLLARRGGKWGLADSAGATMIPFQYDQISTTSHLNEDGTSRIEGWLVHCGQGMGLRGRDGALLIPCRFQSISVNLTEPERHGAAVMLNGRWGWYDPRSQRLLSRGLSDPPVGPGGGRNVGDTLPKRSILPQPKQQRASRRPLSSGEQPPLEPVGPVIALPFFDRRHAGFQHRRELDSFEKNGMRWRLTRAIVPQLDSYPEPYGDYVAVEGENEHGDKKYAVVDSSLSFVIAPQDQYELMGGDIAAGYLVVRPAGSADLYGVTDLRLREVVPPQPRFIGAMFHWEKDRYLIASCRVRPLLYRQDKDAVRFEPFQFTVTDEKGAILPGFERTYRPRFFNDAGDAPLSVPVNDVIRTENTATGAIGFLRLDGQAAFPAIQFVYRFFRMLGPDLAIARELSTGWEALVHLDGRSLIPALDTRLECAGGYGSAETIIRNDTAGAASFREGLYRINYRPASEDDSLRERQVYFDRHGTVYADEEALR